MPPSEEGGMEIAMKHYEITKPIGLRTPCEEIEKACEAAHVYRRCGLRPRHFIIPLNSGNGRTTLIEYMADMYKESGVLDFISGLDDYIEITLDGSLQQLKQAFAEIDAAAVYTNEYSNIIGLDISGIASHLGETQFTEFLRNVKRICDHACVVFFVSALPSRNEERLLERLCEAVENIKRLSVEPYTREDICDLIVQFLDDHGTRISEEESFRKELQETVVSLDIMCVKEAAAAVEELVFYADFSGFVPAVDACSLKLLTESRKKGRVRRDVK